MKYGCDPDRVLKVLKFPDSGKFNEEYLKKATAEIVEIQIDQSNAVLWNFYISDKPLEDSKSYWGLKRRPIKAMMVLIDIPLLLVFITPLEMPPPLLHCLFDYLKEWMKKLLISFDVVFLGLGRVILKSQLQRNDENALHVSNYSGKKIPVWATENESNCLMMVKRIRKRTRSKFNCVIGTAIAASMTAYFKRNNFPVPNFTSGMTTLLLSFPKLDPTKPVPLVNKTAGLSVHLPSHTSIISIDSFHFLRTPEIRFGFCASKINWDTTWDTIVKHSCLPI
ncbi:hypothetical protein HUJ04_004748 [Dendroctonus ponderosae]|nr:hypothetical protein HUJ04_004748 [Dendroctonus ponderosae]